MNLPQLEDLGSLNSALLSLRSLEELVLDLSGCQVSLEMRTELQKSIRTLKRRRGTLDLLWISIMSVFQYRITMDNPPETAIF